MNDEGCLLVMVLALAVAFIIGFCAVDYSASYCNKHTETIVVTNKSAGTDPYLIYTEKQVYAIQYLFWESFYTPAELYNQIHVGDTLKVTVVGKRDPMLGSYKNIIKAQKAKK